MVPPTSHGGPVPPLLGGSRLDTRGRHQSLPNEVVSRELMTRNGLRKTTNFGKGSPRLSPIGGTTTPPAEDALKQQDQHHQQQPQSQAMPPAAVSKGGEFSESWPRSRVSLRGTDKKGLDSRPPAVMEQITADPLKAVGTGELMYMCVQYSSVEIDCKIHFYVVGRTVRIMYVYMHMYMQYMCTFMSICTQLMIQ